MKPESRSPLRDKPLRNPGQSVEEARRKLIEDKFESAAYMAAFLLGIAALEWWKYVSKAPPQPVLMTLVALAALAFSFWRLWRIRPQSRSLRQAIEGERAVGQFLEALRERGYKIFHDILSDGFNVDHVIIGAAGVFTVETKTWSKPAKGDARIWFDGERLTVGQFQPDRDPIVQARAQASWLREILRASAGKDFDVRPVVVFPGWFVDQELHAKRDVWVLNPKALPSFLDNERQRLSAEDVQLASFHLSRYIRAAEAEQK